MGKDGMKYYGVRILSTEKIPAASEVTEIMNHFISSQFCVRWYINTSHFDTV